MPFKNFNQYLGEFLLLLIFLLLTGSIINLLPTVTIWQEININAGGYYLVLHLVALLFFILLPKLLTKSLGDLGFYAVGGILIAFVFNYSAPLIPYYYPAKVPAKELTPEQVAKKSCTVLFSNTLRTNPDVKPLRDLIDLMHPDIIAAVETSPDWIRDMHLRDAYPFAIEKPSDGYFGLAVYSKFSLEEIQVTLPQRIPEVIVANIHFQDKILSLGVLHTLPPQAGRILPNHVLLNALTDATRDIRGPLIFAGDFNATPYSNIFHDFLSRNQLLSAQYGYGYEKTWTTFSPFLLFTLDHILYRGPLTVTEFKRLPTIGSDHFPLLARFAID